MEKVHVKKRFSLFVPFDGEQTVFEFQTNPSFGLLLVYNRVRIVFTLKLFCKQRLTSKEYEQPDCLCWATKTPLTFSKSVDEGQQSGLLLQLKVKQGAFDFRKVEKRFIRLQIECGTSEGQLINTATSEFFQLLPRKRKSDTFVRELSAAVLSVRWKNVNSNQNFRNSARDLGSHELNERADSLNNNAAPEYYQPRNMELERNDLRVSSDESEQNNPSHVDNAAHAHSGYLQYNDSSESDLVLQSHEDVPTTPGNDYEQQEPLSVYSMVARSQNELHHQRANEQYMVLYNGNAEVVGNFRALNFYKASDINIKEDVRLLMEEHDPRDVLLKIDGVSYKFKPGTTHSTQRRFVGYIAQQIESVVPEAVQLIDGVLHVDYESLIPYLSESIKQNFNDINAVKSEQDRIKVIVDMLYEDFLQRDRGKRYHDSNDNPKKTKLTKSHKVLLAVLSIVFTAIAVMIGMYFIVDFNIPVDDAPSPSATPSWQSPTHSLTPLSTATPPPLPAPAPSSSPLPTSTPSPTITEKDPDRVALEDLYAATNGDDWRLRQGYEWLSDAPMCSWSGVKCRNGRVIELALYSINLRGTIPDSIGTLNALEHLDLNGNNLTGTIPSSIIQLKNLTYLAVQRNINLSGTIPDLPLSLQYFFAGNCNLSGTIPRSIVNMTKLFSLVLESNQLRGTIPPLPANLGVLFLSGNQLEGTLPQFKLHNTKISLNVANNSLTGTLENLADTKVSGLEISNNKFEGEVVLFNFTLLRSLFIDGNLFTSFKQSTSEPFDYFEPFYCNARGNHFKCPIPSWLKKDCKATCK